MVMPIIKALLKTVFDYFPWLPVVLDASFQPIPHSLLFGFTFLFLSLLLQHFLQLSFFLFPLRLHLLYCIFMGSLAMPPLRQIAESMEIADQSSMIK